MTPSISVTLDGREMAAAFYARLVSVECTDAAGVASDVATIRLNDGPEVGFLALPRKGSEFTVSLGWGSPQLYGRYTVDTVEVATRPYGLTVSGKAADLRGDMKTNKDRHWDEKPIKDIVAEIAGEHGLKPQVSDKVGAYVYEWLGQDGEGDLHFLERLARRHDALFTVKDGKLIFAERGSGATAGGKPLPVRVITDVVPGTCRVTLGDRGRYKDAVAHYRDPETRMRKEERATSEPDGEADYLVGPPLASKGEAKRAAETAAKDLKRTGDRLSVTVFGDATIAAGMPVVLEGHHPELDGREWTITTARQRVTKDNWTTSIQAEAKA